ncbi:ATP-binding cassette domain-containing protein [Gardnerella vaginalis]|uniref:ATP-binding cassette domain-containing protein n=1 Tax=Gardnerella vaginalis TaxID=2702 RepID=UPI0001E8E9F7|nr:ATP-binding cassette domain-containing protein [Gardnerella vaginalis]
MYGQNPLLQLKDISVNFGFTEALKSITLDIYSKEIVAIVGDNGVGKSTLIKTISGLIQPTKGRMIFEDKEVNLHSIREANDLGIATVFQGQEFCDNLDVTSNLFLGKEMRNKSCHTLNKDAMACEARKALQELTCAIRIHTPIRLLSSEQRQTVALARMLLSDPKLILLDEPTASLSLTQTAETLSYMKRLRSQGRTIILVCHNLPDVFAVATRIVVLRQGKIVGNHDVSETNYVQIIREMTGIEDEEDDTISSSIIDNINENQKLSHKRNALISRSAK